MPSTPAPTIQAVALLERAIDYTRIALYSVRADLLDAPTPCAQWDLRTLLEHMDDSLRLRACSALGAWSAQHGHNPIAVGGAPLDAGVLAGAGALEITVHGWDVAQACGLDHPIPASLADSLLDV